MSGFAPPIVGRLARICLAYDALFEFFGLPQKSHYNATKAHNAAIHSMSASSVRI